MAMGLPCVSTRCAGADEYIIDGENGFLVNIGDEEGTARGISKLLRDEELRKKFSERTVKTSENYLLPAEISRWDDLIVKDGGENE